MKVAIMLDTTGVIDWYMVYPYSWKFRLLGRKHCCTLTGGWSEEDAIKNAKKVINGKITLIRIVEI